MIGGRMRNIIEGFASDRDHMRLTKGELLGRFQTEWKVLRRPTKNGLPNLAPLRADRNFGANSSNCVSGGIFQRNVNVAVCFHFCVNDAARKRVPFLL